MWPTVRKKLPLCGVALELAKAACWQVISTPKHSLTSEHPIMLKLMKENMVQSSSTSSLKWFYVN